ncbi:hypothetical protein CRENBAI_012181 [Crenichthys baileyi]|uniref:Uncharacterized protein n=1 Tax=Crenichthys baileyi TaxID=28760 RepID=A0AAV9SBT2_9TELE
MRCISASIFERDPEDVSRLKRAKQAERSRRGTVHSAKEMARHWMARMEEIWRTQRKHVACIQDPLGVHVYTRTGQVTKGGVVLPVYRCARGSTSLESFHLHLNRFIPGELIGMSYLYAQTGQELQMFPYDPDDPDGGEEIILEDVEASEEDRLLDVLEEGLDEVSVELAEDQLGPSLQTPSFQPPSPPPPPPSPHSHQGTSGAQEVTVGPDGTPGYQHVVRLARKLVELCRKGYISNAEVEEIVGL